MRSRWRACSRRRSSTSATLAERFEVANACGGRHEHASAREMRAPAEADVVEEEADPFVVATDLREQVGAHERAGTRDAEHITDGVVLLLVELAPVDQRHLAPELVDRLAHLEQPPRVVPAHELGPDDRGIRPKCLLDHDPHDPGLERDVVVAEEEERGAVDDVEHLVGGRAEALVDLEPADERAGHHSGDTRRRVDRAGGVDHQDREVRVVLGAQGEHRLVEPATRITGDDNGNDRRRGGLGRACGLHDAQTLPSVHQPSGSANGPVGRDLRHVPGCLQ